jgi:hypothetical protein
VNNDDDDNEEEEEDETFLTIKKYEIGFGCILTFSKILPT